MTKLCLFAIAILALASLGCSNAAQNSNASANTETKPAVAAEAPKFFNLRPEAEKMYGYSHAVRIGNDLKVSGAVSMDEKGNPTAKGDLAKQMKNCYDDLGTVLKRNGFTWDDVTVENIYTTNMAEFIKQSGYRKEIYAKNFPTGTWLEVKGLALPEFMIEIEIEAHKVK